MWGSMGFDADELAEERSMYNEIGEKEVKHGIKMKADLSPCRKESIEKKEDLRVTDFAVGGFEFFAHAEEGYNRTIPELTLHQVLRRLMRLVERELLQNAEKLEAKIDTTLLHPPAMKEQDNFYTDALAKIKDHKDYFIGKAAKDSRGARQSHKFQGNYRSDDKLDGLFRGKNSGDLSFYTRDKKAGATMHSKIGWKSTLAKHDQLAVSDPNALQRSLEVEKQFNQQGAWIIKQKKDMTQRNDRYEHLVHIIKTEMHKEHERETKELEGAVSSKSVSKKAQMDVWLDRLNSIDEIMFVLKEYKIVGALDEADLLVYQVEKWAAVMKTQKTVENKRSIPDPNAKPVEDLTKGIYGGSAGELGEGEGHHGNAFVSIIQGVVLENQKGKEEGDGSDIAEGGRKRPTTGQSAKSDKDEKDPVGVANSMMAAGASPYYEADIALERHQQLAKKLSKHWKKSPVKPDLGIFDDEESQGSLEQDDDDDENSLFSLDSGTVESSKYGKESMTNDSISILRSGRVRVIPTKFGGKLPKGLKVDMSKEQYDLAMEAEANRNAIKKDIRRRFPKKTIMAEDDVIDAQKVTHEEVRLAKAEFAKKKLKTAQWKPPNNARKVVLMPHEIDEAKMREAKRTFTNAGLGRNIRKGRQDDLAFLVPSLIPVPGAFEGDDTERLSSYAGAKIVDGLQDRMCSDLGHTERRLLPLYVRNTLLEVNGTSANGDQSNEVMSKDRRYSHYHGRPLVRFEPGKELQDSRDFIAKQGKGFGPNKKELSDKLAPMKAEKLRVKTEMRVKEQRYKPMNRSLVRLVFGQEVKNPNDLAFVEAPI